MKREKKIENKIKLIIITGLSGAGKTEALKYLGKMKFVSKAIRNYNKVIYRAEISRRAIDTLLLVGEFDRRIESEK